VAEETTTISCEITKTPGHFEWVEANCASPMIILNSIVAKQLKDFNNSNNNDCEEYKKALAKALLENMTKEK